MARVTRAPLRGVVVHDAPAPIDAANEQRGRAGGRDRIATADAPRQDVLGDQVRDVRCDRIDVEDPERERVAHHLAGEQPSVRVADGGRTAHEPAAADVRGGIARQVVAHEGVEVAAVPIDGGTLEHRLELGTNRGALLRRGTIATHRARARRGEHQTAEDDPCRSPSHAPTSSSWPAPSRSWRAAWVLTWRRTPSPKAWTPIPCWVPSRRPWPVPSPRSWPVPSPPAWLGPWPLASARLPSPRAPEQEPVAAPEQVLASPPDGDRRSAGRTHPDAAAERRPRLPLRQRRAPPSRPQPFRLRSWTRSAGPSRSPASWSVRPRPRE